MADVTISGSDLELNKESWEEIIVHSNSSSSKIYLAGIVRAPKPLPSSKLDHILSKPRQERGRLVKELFLQTPGDYTVIIEDQETVSFYVGYSCPQFYIQAWQDNGYLLTQNESAVLQGGFDSDKLFLRYASRQGLFIPKGVANAVTDYLLPGMSLVYSRKTNEYQQSWIIDISEFCTRNNHDQLAREIADSFADELASFEYIEGDLKLELSSGVDSALLLAAARESGIDLQPVNYRPSIRSGESLGAKRMADYFDLPLHMLYRGPGSADKLFSADTDVTDYLVKMEPLLKSGSAMFILDNVSLLSAYEFGFHNTLQGSSYPTALCIAHYTSYPKHKSFSKPRFIPGINKEKRHSFSIYYTESRIGNEDYIDEWGIGERYPFIDPYYWEFLNPCFTGTSKSNSLQHILTDLIDGSDEILMRSLRSRGYSIIDKIILDTDTREALAKPSAQWASKLMKLIIFIHNNGWTISKTFNYRPAGIMSEFQAGLSSKILTKLLSVAIDEKLINYPKWHIFRAFEMLAGKSFFEISYSQKNFTTAYSELLKKLRFKLAGAESERPTILRNKSVWRYITDNRIDSTHSSILEDHGLNAHLKTVSAISDPTYSKTSRFWYLNNILNLSNLNTQATG
jgi:hypothetical protein